MESQYIKSNLIASGLVLLVFILFAFKKKQGGGKHALAFSVPPLDWKPGPNIDGM